MKVQVKKLLWVPVTAILGVIVLQACKKTFLDAQPYGQYGIGPVVPFRHYFI